MASGGSNSYQIQNNLNDEPNLVKNADVVGYDKYDDGCCNKYPKTARCLWCCCGTWLFIFAIQATFLPSLLQNAVSSGVEDALIFTEPKPDDDNYNSWVTNVNGPNAVPVWMECRFFNVTNKEELLSANGSNGFIYPNLTLTPPLIYNEMYLKYNINFSFYGQKQWVEYQTYTYYTLMDKPMYKYQLQPHDHVVIVSPIVGAIYYAWKFNRLAEKWGVNELAIALSNIDPSILFWEGTAEEVLFNISQFNISYHGKKIIDMQLGFGLLGNGSAPDSPDARSTYEVTHTGHDAPHRMGEVLFYGVNETGDAQGWVNCYDPAMQIWPAKDTYFGINNVRKHDIQMIWVNTLFKNIALNFNYSYTWKHDIELYRYTVQAEPQYVNASWWPPNAQFNLYGISGVQNLTSCQGVPIFVSFPFFLAADDFIVNNHKMNLPSNPSWDLLPTVDVQPNTGGIFKANKSLQLNTIIHSMPFTNKSDKIINKSLPWAGHNLHWIPDGLIVPMLELSECEEYPDDQAKTFASEVVAIPKWATRLEWIGVVSGCLFAAWSTLCGYWIARNKDAKKRYAVE